MPNLSLKLVHKRHGNGITSLRRCDVCDTKTGEVVGELPVTNITASSDAFGGIAVATISTYRFELEYVDSNHDA